MIANLIKFLVDVVDDGLLRVDDIGRFDALLCQLGEDHSFFHEVVGSVYLANEAIYIFRLLNIETFVQLCLRHWLGAQRLKV